MEATSIDTVLKNIYDARVSYIRHKNIELEREYFTQNSAFIPMSEIMQGASYEDHFMNFKSEVKEANTAELDQIFTLLQEYFLFSAGHDMMFKKKLEADVFTSVPLDFIFHKYSLAVRGKYNDVSVMKENPNHDANINGIDNLAYTYTEVASLLYLLYCNDFSFPNNWEGLCPDTHEEVLTILKESGMTIGDFLHALIDFKCQRMIDIFSEIANPTLKKTYLDKVLELKKQKHKETDGFAHVNLPITYFLDHTYTDFILMEHKSTLLDDTTPNGDKKILLP